MGLLAKRFEEAARRMNFQEFQASLSGDAPPSGLSSELQALWYEAKGDWDKAHSLVQNSALDEASWIHAYLHRKEGDRSNAQYWYRAAGKNPQFDLTLPEEWSSIVRSLLAAGE